MKKLEYKISIAGTGTPEDIVRELREIAKIIEAEAAGEDAEEVLSGNEWEGKTLITTINAK